MKTYQGGVDLAGPEFGIAGNLSVEVDSGRVVFHSHMYGETGMTSMFHRLTHEEAAQLADELVEASATAWENASAEETRMP